MNYCSICGGAIFPPNMAYGYVGPVCTGVHTVTMPASPPLEYGRYQFTPTPLTADDIRKIVREEIERSRLGKRDE